MILRILKSNRPVNYLLTTLFGLILWSASLMKPYLYSFYNGESNNILYKPIHEFLKNNLIAESIISLVLVLLLAFLIQLLNTQYAFIRIRTMLPAPLFVLIIGGLTDIHTLHPVYFAAIFLLLAIYRLFSAFDVQRPYSAAFDSGFFLGVGALFYFDIILLFPAFLAGTAILSRESNWRNFTINIIGLLLPFFFALSYGVFTEQLMELLKTFEQNIISVNNHFKMNLYLQFFLAFLILFTVLGSAKLIQQYDTKKVSSRKYFNVLLLIFLFSLAGFILVPPVSQEMLVILAIPICFLVTNFFVFLKSRFWGEFLIYLLIGIVFSLQITAF
ncbi:hypothetical protein GM418_09830 [Maribellus comscasis]|uniref:Beta-carotene 15,15'-monooxygenase n=1 Tax=Maribellus comscasis TaxID=2681766 RepID=A0A6I6JM55_9BACT|nr:DUF6427 family protein [Maribellus comscasis]QGY43945.1 hypothetical protein GM418_09830 [Maribellus comscasis]